MLCLPLVCFQRLTFTTHNMLHLPGPGDVRGSALAPTRGRSWQGGDVGKEARSFGLQI